MAFRFLLLFLLCFWFNQGMSSYSLLERFSERLGPTLFRNYEYALNRLATKSIVPAILEIPVPYNKIYMSADVATNYPCIPSKCTPWQIEAGHIADVSNNEKPIFNLRTRDFQRCEDVITFIRPFADKVRILLVYGDGNEAGSNLAPRDLIKPIQALGIDVGVVVNPTPVMRSASEEKASFITKLNQKPNFVITQCFYDVKEADSFFKDIWKMIKFDKKIKIYANLGFWKPTTPLIKFGIKAAGCYEPSDELLDYVKSGFFSGVSLCCFQTRK